MVINIVGQMKSFAKSGLQPGLALMPVGKKVCYTKPSKSKHAKTWKQRSTGSASELAEAIVASARPERE